MLGDNMLKKNEDSIHGGQCIAYQAKGKQSPSVKIWLISLFAGPIFTRSKLARPDLQQERIAAA